MKLILVGRKIDFDPEYISGFEQWCSTAVPDDSGVEVEAISDDDSAPEATAVRNYIAECILQFFRPAKNDFTYEIMTASYVTPHTDDVFLSNPNDMRPELQMLTPIYLSKSGYQLRVGNEKVDMEIGVPYFFDPVNYEHRSFPVGKLTAANEGEVSAFLSCRIRVTREDARKVGLHCKGLGQYYRNKVNR